ncbi:MAG: hypothetical protein U0401_26155 [Anaerolineae bacterium]
MNWFDPYQAKRNHYWPEFEAFFSALPPPLFQQGVLLKNNLATFFAAGGQFAHLLCRERDHPLLYWHFWLLDDLGCPDTPARADLERRLFLAMAFAFAAVYTRESILDSASNFDASFIFLDHALSQQSDFHLGQLFPAASPFWRRYHACWDEYAVALLTTEDRRSFDLAQDEPPTAKSQSPITNLQLPITNLRAKYPISNLQSLSPHLAFTKISPAAVIAYVEQDDLWPQLEALLDRLNAVLQLLREIANLRRDIMQRRLTYPILTTLELAGLDTHPSLSPERILGALVLTGTVPKMCQAALNWLTEGRAIAQNLKLPTFTEYVGVLEAWLEEVQNLFSLKSEQPPARQTSLFAPAVDTLPKVIEMAESYLLADLTFRESWEIQRRGLFGVNEMTAKAFPMGLVAEILARHGHNMSGPINDIFQTLQASGFRYYNHPHLPPDTDDLGLLLRLFPHSAQPELHQAMLQTPLRWLEENIVESGHIPVWLTRFDAPDKMEVPGAALWGHRCATVEANVLLGLLAFDAAAYAPVIEPAARQWSQTWLKRGLGGTHHYVPLYALWTALELVAQLQSFASSKNRPETGECVASPRNRRPIINPRSSVSGLRSSNDFLDSLAQLTPALTNHLTVETRRAHLTPQDAAFLILACRSNPSLFNPEWLTLLAKSQRYDGSWAAEPLYGTPTRGELAAWYGSRTVTTAFCYHALKTFSAR